MFAGLWSGAKSEKFLMSSKTSSVITTELEYLLPPCTTRCPTPLISSKEAITLLSNNSLIRI